MHIQVYIILVNKYILIILYDILFCTVWGDIKKQFINSIRTLLTLLFFKPISFIKFYEMYKYTLFNLA